MKLSPEATPDKEEILDLDAFVPFQLSVTANVVSDMIARAYRSLFGLRVPEWRVVAILAQSPGLGGQAIARRAGLDKITVSRAVAALRGRGLIVVEAHPRDGRAQRLSLSAEGYDLYRAIVPAARALEARAIDCLSLAERAQLSALLARIRDAARVP